MTEKSLNKDQILKLLGTLGKKSISNSYELEFIENPKSQAETV